MLFDHKKKENSLLLHLPVELQDTVKKLKLEDGKEHVFEMVNYIGEIYQPMRDRGAFRKATLKLEPMENGNGTNLLYTSSINEGFKVNDKTTVLSNQFHFLNGTLTGYTSENTIIEENNRKTETVKLNDSDSKVYKLKDSDPKFNDKNELEFKDVKGQVIAEISHRLGEIQKHVAEEVWKDITPDSKPINKPS